MVLRGIAERPIPSLREPLDTLFDNQMPVDTFFAVCIGISALAAIIAHFGMMRSSNELVDYQYLVAREEWERDGRPEGGEITKQKIGFWNLGNLRASGCQVERWLGAEGRSGSRPDWMIGDFQALEAYRRLKRWSVLKTIAVIAMIGSIIGFMVAAFQW